MSFLGIVRRSKIYLEEQGRVSLSALKLEFELDDDGLEALVTELVDVQQVAAREGKLLSWVGPGAAAAAPIAPAPAGERRQLTVMFCDLVGSTELSGRLDPEDWRDVLRAYQEAAGLGIARYEGHVAQYLGDGVLVYFGYPQAHEEDAERAVRAGLEILTALAGLNERLEAGRGIRLAVRIGIHTGPVVVAAMGSGSRSETLALGDTTNVAARLADAAEPDTIVISDATRRIVPGMFVTKDLGTPPLRGVVAAVRAFAVLQATGVRSRLEVDSARLTPFVGRKREVASLLELWRRAQQGEGQAVLISGEAGLGKSRLLLALREQLVEQAHGWLECRCSPYTQGSAFHPLIELMERGLGFQGGDEPEAKLARLENGIAATGLPESEAVPLIAKLLSLPAPNRSPPLQMSPELQRQRTLETLVGWALALGERQPLLLVVEDLHWCDPSTLEFLGLLLAELSGAKVLTLLTFRPEFEPPWSGSFPATDLAIERLSCEAAGRLIAAMTRDRPLPEGVVARIVERADGIPLFLEELTKTLRESMQERVVPATLHDSLMARLDRLGEGKALAQLAAVLGREFLYELLRDVSPWPEDALQHGLARLVDADLLYPRGSPPQASYAFKHGMIQETAYGSLLKSVRRQFHARVAEVLEARYPERVQSEPELIARHYEEAGLAEKAILAYRWAGERATEHSANTEAIGHLSRALTLLETLPESLERNQQELRLRVAIAAPLGAARGWADPDTGAAYERARKLVLQSGETPDLPRILEGLAVFYYVKGDLARSTELAQQTLEAAERRGDGLDLLAAHLALGQPLFFRGDFERALHHIEQAIQAYDPERHAVFAATAGNDRGVNGLSFAGLCHWNLGRPDRAVAMSQQAVALARRLEHPMSLASALFWEGTVRYLRREAAITTELAEEIIAIAEERGFPLYLSLGRCLRGWARAEAGEGEAGLAEIEQALAALARTATGVGAPLFLASLAEAERRLGRHDQALAVLSVGCARSREMGQPFCDAEMHRLRAEILLDRDGDVSEEPEVLLLRALSIARSQGARSFELRAATGLARLLAKRGQSGQALDLLAPVYEEFTEGFQTTDLREARALLATLRL
ncbi:MAG: AAA family ATPase [Myxococcota bacterium]